LAIAALGGTRLDSLDFAAAELLDTVDGDISERLRDALGKPLHIELRAEEIKGNIRAKLIFAGKTND